MPDDTNGNHSLAPGYRATTGEKIIASQHNPPLEDLSSAMTNRLHRDGRSVMLGNLPMGGYRITGMGAGTSSTDGATVGQATSAGVPIATVLDFAGSQLPTGYLWCAGQAVSRTTYADLFAAVGTQYGTGNGSTTFNLPDLRGRVGAGRTNMNDGTASTLLTSTTMTPGATTLGATGGAQTHELTEAQNGQHSHTGVTSGNGLHAHAYDDVRHGGGSGSAVFKWPFRQFDNTQ